MAIVTRSLFVFGLLVLTGSAFAQEISPERVFNSLVTEASHAGTVGPAVTAEDIVILDDPEWLIRTGDVDWFDTDDAMRSAAYNPVTDHVLIATRTGGPQVRILHPANGQNIGSLNMTGVGGGALAINEIAVTEDGQIFLANLITADDQHLRIYRWANETTAPSVVFDGTLVGGRYGDALAVSGVQTDVRVYISGSDNDRIAQLAWDGTMLTSPSYIIPEAGVPVARMGISHSRQEDSLWVNQPGGALMKIGLDGGVGRVVSADVLPLDYGDLDVFEWNQRIYALAGPLWNDDHRFLVVDVTAPGEEFVAMRTEGLGSNTNANAVGFAATDWKRGNLLVGATNNAIASFSVSSHPNQAPTASQIVLPQDGHTVLLEGDPTTQLSIHWTRAVDPNDDTVLYYWQLATSSDFSAPLVSVNTGIDTFHVMTYDQLVAIFEDEIAPGESVSAFHRVIATDGALGRLGPHRSITFTRGSATDVEPVAGLPSDFVLHGNYPNPFNPTTSIRFDLPRAAEVQVEVFDVLGRRMMSQNHILAAGANQTVSLDAAGLASGTYIYRVLAQMQGGEQRVETGTMLLVK